MVQLFELGLVVRGRDECRSLRESALYMTGKNEMLEAVVLIYMSCPSRLLVDLTAAAPIRVEL